MPRSMSLRAPRLSLAACVLALAAPTGLVACNDEKQGVDEPAREGLSLPLDGVDYNVFITRELNPDITPDKAYVKEQEAPPGQALYGVFLRACNTSSEERTTVSRFTVRDNQDNTFEPEPLPADNAFAYSSQTLDPKECIPEAGSVAQLGPTAGAMLLFKLPLENTENRPLELEVEADNGQKLTFTLDI
jgi:hypothetical protein